MKRIKNLFTWYCMFTKRIFHKYSFIMILLLIPLSIPAAKIAITQEDSGIMNIALYAEGENNPAAHDIINKLTASDSVLRFTVFKTYEKAENAVLKKDVDCAWIFPENTKQKISDYVSDNPTKPIVKVIVTEENTMTRLSNEKLYSVLFQHISYETYKDFLFKHDIISENTSDDIILSHYNKYIYEDSLVEIQKMDSDVEIGNSENYLLTPIRGILAILIMLCGFASAMYFLSDQAEGKYDWLSYRKKLAPAFGSCLSAIATSSVAVLIALYLSGMFTKAYLEITAMILYALSATGFCLILCILFRSAGRLGACIPFLTIVMLVLCPIFFSINYLEEIRMLLPPWYYLNAVTDSGYIAKMAMYSVCSYVIAFILNIILNRNERKISMLS